MRPYLLIAVGLILLSLLTSTQASSPSFINNEIRRYADISKHFEDQVVLIKATNTGSGAANSYRVAFDNDKATHLAFVEALSISKPSASLTADASAFLLLSKPSEKANRLVTHRAVDQSNNHNVTFFDVVFDEAVATNKQVAFYLFLSFTRTLTPLPAYKLQDEAQLVLYNDNYYFTSPYPTELYKSTYKLQSSHIETYTRKHATVKSDTIEYGPITDTIAPFSHAPLAIHYQNNAPFVTATSFRKEIEVSHWGNIAITEWYEMLHTGAILTGEFSRFEYQRQQNSAPGSYNLMRGSIPVNAHGVYYRDVIGNVSTSRVRKARTETVVEIQPRYPMFGGWKTEFEIGYNVPANTQLSVIDRHAPSAKSQVTNYLLNVTFGSMFPLVAIDEAEIRVILPEGASHIEWLTPFSIDSVDDAQLHFTHLDTTGRPVLVLRKTNVVHFHNQNFQVAYHFTPVDMMREPFLVIAAAMAFFAISFVYYRVELGVGHELEHSKLE